MRSNIRSKIIRVPINPYFHMATVKVWIANKTNMYVDFNGAIPDYLYRVRCYA